jgi:hypothetical protein
MSKSLASLKTEAIQLGIDFQDNVTATALQKIIDTHYDSLEASNPSAPVVVEEEVTEAPTAAPAAKAGKMTIGQKARIAEAEARKTRIVTVFDNDTRENNETTVAVVNCGNTFFDLGTVYVPLGERVEIMLGHLNVLKEVQIPHHMSSGSGSRVTSRNRYTINYED